MPNRGDDDEEQYAERDGSDDQAEQEAKFHPKRVERREPDGVARPADGEDRRQQALAIQNILP